MKAAEALIAWNSVEDADGKMPPGSVAIGPLLRDNEGDWTDGFTNTGGAAEMHRRTLTRQDQELAVLKDFYLLVYSYGLAPYVVHRAFLHIDEFQTVIKSMGAGPSRGEHGHDPEVSYGRSSQSPVPKVTEMRIGRSVRISPALG